MGKRRVTLFIEFDGEPNDDSLLAFRVGEAMVNRLNGVGKMEDMSFTPGDAWVKNIDIAVGKTKLAEVKSKAVKGYTAIKTSDLKHG